mgnify:CR=1 FL=1
MRLSAREGAKAFARGDVSWTSSSACSARVVDGVKTFFSYREPIATINEKRKQAWVTSEKFSVTTSRHTGHVAGQLAIAGYEIVRSLP